MSASATRPKAAVFGCAGLRLSDEERQFFEAADPFGFILFSRNVETPEQVAGLVANLRQCVGRGDAPVLIDQEGGRVQRLGPPHWRAAPTGRRFAGLARTDINAARRAARLNARLIADDLRRLGITVNCAPVLDVPAVNGHEIIGDRALGDDPETVAALGRAVCEGLLAGGVLPVIKHLPGHGRAVSDSHLELPVVGAGLEDLRTIDFAPFKSLHEMPWAMTAHVVYSALDSDNPATLSGAVIGGAIRGDIGFDGLLISDDLSMKALAGNFGDRARRALAAGCDVVLHCNGDRGEMTAVADAVGALSVDAGRRIAAAEALRIASIDGESWRRDDSESELADILSASRSAA